MPTLQELRSQIADLEKQAAEMHERESESAIATVKELVQKYALTPEQIGLAPAAKRSPAASGVAGRAARKAVRPGAGIPKFADPATGKTWTGFGKPPAWIASAKDRDAFRIDAAAGSPSAPSKSTAKKTASRKPKAS